MICLVVAIEQNPLPVGLKSPARINEVLKRPKIIVCRNSGRSNRRNVLHLRMANREIHFGSHVQWRRQGGGQMPPNFFLPLHSASSPPQKSH